MTTTSRWIGASFLIASLASVAVASVAVASEIAPASSGSVQSAAIVSLVGEIDDYSQRDLIHRFERARATGAKVILVEIDSPGGLVTSSMEISRFLKRQADVH